MVKGISRRAVVIKPRDSELFDEAIFFVRDDAARKGVTRQELLREASLIAYGEPDRVRRVSARLRTLLAALSGAAAIAAIWLATVWF